MNDIIRTSVTIYVTYLFFFACKIKNEIIR